MMTFKPNIEDEVVGLNVKRMYNTLLDICADLVMSLGDGWRNESNPTGCASNAQLWILGKCLGHASTLETDEDLKRRVERKCYEKGVNP